MKATNRSRPMRGVMLLALLLTMAIGGLGLLMAVDVWAVTRQRQLEQELLFVGEQYRMAFERYYFAAPQGQPRVYPSSLKQLLEDDRYSIPVRHIRRLYPDPVTGEPQWGALAQGNRLIGVYSLGKGVPLKQANFPKNAETFAGKHSYRDWTFVFVPPKNIPVGRAVRPGPGDGLETPPLRSTP